MMCNTANTIIMISVTVTKTLSDYSDSSQVAQGTNQCNFVPLMEAWQLVGNSGTTHLDNVANRAATGRVPDVQGSTWRRLAPSVTRCSDKNRILVRL